MQTLLRLLLALPEAMRLARQSQPLPKEPAPAATPQAPSQFAAGVETMRATTKWLVTIVAAIGAVLTAGLQLSSIGKLDFPSWRLFVAVGAGVVALAMIAWILWALIRILAPFDLSLAQLIAGQAEKDDNGDIKYLRKAGFLKPKQTIADLEQHYLGEKKDMAARARRRARLATIVEAVHYNRMHRNFSRAIGTICFGAVVTALAIGTFSWAANPPTLPPTLYQIPDSGTVELSMAAKDLLRHKLGATCVDAPVKAAILAYGGGKYDVLSMPTDQCKMIRFSIDSEDFGKVIIAP